MASLSSPRAEQIPYITRKTSMVRSVSSLGSKKLQERKRKIRLYKYGGGFLAVVAIVAGLSFLSRASFVRVGNIEVEGTKISKSSEVSGIVQDELNSSYLWIFSRNNISLFSRSGVEKKIYAQSTAIKHASVSFDGLKKINVKITEYEPKYLWCDSETRDHCYFMDSRGYIFSESAGFSSNVIFTFYGLVDPAAPIGKTYMSETAFADATKFIDSMSLLRLSPIGFIARGEGDFELLLSSGSGTGGSIFFSNHEPVLTTFENIETIIDEQTRLDKDFLLKLDYIDVRFSSKAFVRLK